MEGAERAAPMPPMMLILTSPEISNPPVHTPTYSYVVNTRTHATRSHRRVVANGAYVRSRQSTRGRRIALVEPKARLRLLLQLACHGQYHDDGTENEGTGYSEDRAEDRVVTGRLV